MRPFWLQGRKPYYPEKLLISRLLRRRIRPPTVERGTRTHRPLRRCPPGAWSCRKQGLGRSTPRPLWLTFRPQPAPEPPPAAFSAAGRSSTAADPVLAAASPAHSRRRARSRPVPWRSTSQAPHPHRLWRLRRHRRAGRPRSPSRHLARAPALDPLAPAAHPVPAAHRQPARPRARSAPHPEAAADARSIPKPRKAR